MLSIQQQQLDFIAYIQRLLVEGDFNATYKYALLHALADVCVEQGEVNPTATLQINLSTLAEKLIELYWHHAVPFIANQNKSTELKGEDAVLLQNAGKQAKIISELFDCKQSNLRTVRQLKNSPYWQSAYKVALNTLKTGPLWRLQKLANQDECYLYPHHKNKPYITLNAGIADCFRHFYDLVLNLAKTAWLQKIQDLKHNQALIGPQSQLNSFLFDADRNALTQAKPILIDIQKNHCFYCQKPLKKDTQVDHFIPFTRYPHDLGHNFVAAHKTCNNNKRDYIAAYRHRDRWQEQNLVKHSQTLSKELSPYFHCDINTSLAISNWAYQIAQNNQAKLWVGINEFEPAIQLNALVDIKISNSEFTYQTQNMGELLGVAEEQSGYE